MSNVTFVIDRVETRSVNTKYGPKPVFDVYDTAGGKGSFGFKDPSRYGAATGMKVTCLGKVGKYGVELNPDTIVLNGPDEATGLAALGGAGGGSSPSSSGPPTGKSGRNFGAFPINVTDGQMSIIRQNALTNAVSTVADYVATLPAEKWPDIDTWTDHVIAVALKYADFSSGQREVKAGVDSENTKESLLKSHVFKSAAERSGKGKSAADSANDEAA